MLTAGPLPPPLREERSHRTRVRAVLNHTCVHTHVRTEGHLWSRLSLPLQGTWQAGAGAGSRFTSYLYRLHFLPCVSVTPFKTILVFKLRAEGELKDHEIKTDAKETRLQQLAVA